MLDTNEYQVKFMELLDKKTYLSLMQNIEDMQWYAAAWRQLAGEFTAIDAIYNAQDCQSHAEHYGKFTGEYVRLVELPFAELIEVA